MRDELPSIQGIGDVSLRTTGEGIIRGTDTTTDGRPIPHARVMLMGPGRPTQTPRGVITGPLTQGFTTTADDGSYEFGSLPAATYRVAAARSGYSISNDPFGLPMLANLGKAVTLSSNQSRGRANVELIPWGAIGGRVVDEAGDPVQGALVGLLQVRFEGGRRRLVATRTPQRFTNDRGEFRLYGVQPGSYVLAASVADTLAFDLPGYVPTYYPGTAAAAEAGFIDVASGGDVVVADVSLKPALTASISGSLVDADGRPTTGGRFTLVSRSVLATRINARIGQDGHFEFRNVPPGPYVIQADRGLLNGHDEGEFAAVPITVGAGNIIDGIRVQASRGSNVSGRVTFESAFDAPAPDRAAIEIAAFPLDVDLAPSGLANATPKPDDTFQLIGVHGERRLQVVRAPAGWTLKAILSNGRDITDDVVDFGTATPSLESVEVIFTDRVNEVRGRVTDDRANPVAGVRVVLYSTAPTRWYTASRFMASVVTDSDGTYTVAGLPTGSYFAAATTRTPPGSDAWRDPTFLESLRSGTTVLTLGVGERQTANLRVRSR
jgi:protocatechuate 3,4-dioxygenase beta subunit